MFEYFLSLEGARTLLSVILIVGVFLLQLTRKSFSSARIKKILLVAIIGILLLVTYEGYLLYQGWMQSEIGRYLLPPYQNIGYFLFRFFKTSLLSWVVAAVGGVFLAWTAQKLNNRFDERFFEKEEISLFALAAFLVGYPGILFYVIFVLLTELFLTIIYTLGGWGRAPMYYLWLPVALFVMIMMYQVPVYFIRLFSF
jgi:hypothetical protein